MGLMRTLLFFVLCCLAARVPVAWARPGPPPALVAIHAIQWPGERGVFIGKLADGGSVGAVKGKRSEAGGVRVIAMDI